MESWFGADQATIDVLGAAACYTLMGRPRLHQMFWLWGPTGGGKNTFLDGLAAALGKYSFAFDMDLLTGQSFTPRWQNLPIRWSSDAVLVGGFGTADP